jgi:hypothetical protein
VRQLASPQVRRSRDDTEFGNLHRLSILKLFVMFSTEMSCRCHFFPKISNSCHLSAPGFAALGVFADDESLAAYGSNALDPRRLPSAHAGRAQGRREAAAVAAFLGVR